MVDIKVLDHFIVAGTAALSFAERGLVARTPIRSFGSRQKEANDHDLTALDMNL